jgi:heat shock protein HspQ
MTQTLRAKFGLGQIVRHRDHAFFGLIVDVDAGWAGPAGQAGPEDRDQPFYRVLAMGEDAGFMVYAAEAMLEPDLDVEPLTPADEAKWFTIGENGRHAPRYQPLH